MLRSLALITAALLAAGTAAAAPHVAGTRDAKPGLFVTAPVRAVFDCSGRDTLQLVPGLVDTLRDDTTGGPTDLDGYACRAWPELGPEHVYRLEVAADLELWAGLREIGDLDLDLFLLGGCDTDQCLAGENIELAASLAPGTYWLVVDGYGTNDTLNAGTYALALETRAPGLPAEICSGGVAEPLACTVGGGIARQGTIFGQPDLVRSYACNPYLARGGEVWYALDLLPGQEFTASMPSVADSLDAVLWLFAGCGPEAECLAVADEEIAGVPESLSWQSTVAQPVTVWLAVDGARPATSATAGEFELTITCGTEVPVERSTFGGLRALYR